MPGLDGWTSTSSISFVVAAGHGDDSTRSLYVLTGGDSGYGYWLAGPAYGFNNGLAAASPAGGNYVALDGTDYGDGTLSQTVNGLTVGQQYKLSFWWGAGTLNTAYSGYDSSIGWDVSVKRRQQSRRLVGVAAHRWLQERRPAARMDSTGLHLHRFDEV